MTNETLEFGGVRYWLSASAEGQERWVGEANVVLHGDHVRPSRIVPTVEKFSHASDAMHAAGEQLKALHLSGALRQVMPDAYAPEQ